MLYLRQKNFAKALYLPQEFNQRITLWTKARQKNMPNIRGIPYLISIYFIKKLEKS